MKRFGLAVVAGLLLAAAFPRMNLSVMGWLVPGLMLAIALGQSGGTAFRLGFVTGFVFHLASFYWLLFIPVKFAPIVGWILLSAYLALFQGVWVWLSCRLYRIHLVTGDHSPFWQQFLMNRWQQQLTWSLSCAALWVACEMVQARFLTGMPWNLLGVSQYRMIPVIQIASVVGVYGISFLMVWFSVSLISVGALMVLRPDRPRDWMIEIMPPLFIVVLVVAFGMRRAFYTPETSATLKVTMVQPSIPQTTIWNDSLNQQRFGELLSLTESALTNDTDLLVWPEAAVPSMLRWETNTYHAVTNIVSRHKVWMVMGSEDVKRNERIRPDGYPDYDFYNCSFLIAPNGQLRSQYIKRKLVIFGEYVPLADWFPFLRDFTTVGGDFTPGLTPMPFHLTDLNVKTSVLICFEDIFPHLAPEYVEKDTDFLLNLTNDGWFGHSAAQWQHAANAVFRAVENGVPLVRCTNNGLTCWIDEWGRMHAVYFPGTTDIYGRGVKTIELPIRSKQNRVLTLYRRHGDWFGWGCVLWTFLLCAWRVLGGSSPRQDASPGWRPPFHP